nr:hypothetical protein [Rhodoferax sp.]
MLLVISLLSSFALAVPLAVARVSPRPWLSKTVWFYTYVLRGTPLLCNCSSCTTVWRNLRRCVRVRPGCCCATPGFAPGWRSR